VASLISYLNGVHAKYGSTLWLTEFGMISFTGSDPSQWSYPTVQQAIDYMTLAVPALRNLGFLERFSWYPMAYMPGIIAANPNAAHITLVDNVTGARTALGDVYASL
jgi:hypothetical protein